MAGSVRFLVFNLIKKQVLQILFIKSERRLFRVRFFKFYLLFE